MQNIADLTPAQAKEKIIDMFDARFRFRITDTKLRHDLIDYIYEVMDRSSRFSAIAIAKKFTRYALPDIEPDTTAKMIVDYVDGEAERVMENNHGTL